MAELEYKSKFTGAEIDDTLSKARSSEKFTAAEKAKLAGLSNYDDSEIKGEISDNEDAINTHIANTSNPHGVTKVQIGLGNVDNTSDANKPVSTAQQVALNNKVDKISGKGLSTNDFSDAYKNQIDANSAGIGAIANSGCKNLFVNSQASKTEQGLNFTTQSDGTARVQGGRATGYADYYFCGPFSSTDVKYDFSDGDYILSFEVIDTATGEEISSNYIYCRIYDKSENPSAGAYVRLNSSGEVIFSGKITAMLFTVQPEYGEVGDITVKTMIRHAGIADSTYQPYAPTNRELYELILALQSGNSANSLRSSELLSINSVDATEEKE